MKRRTTTDETRARKPAVPKVKVQVIDENHSFFMIVSSRNDFSLCFSINNALGIHLKRSSESLDAHPSASSPEITDFNHRRSFLEGHVNELTIQDREENAPFADENSIYPIFKAEDPLLHRHYVLIKNRAKNGILFFDPGSLCDYVLCVSGPEIDEDEIKAVLNKIEGVDFVSRISWKFLSKNYLAKFANLLGV